MDHVLPETDINDLLKQTVQELSLNLVEITETRILHGADINKTRCDFMRDVCINLAGNMIFKLSHPQTKETMEQNAKAACGYLDNWFKQSLDTIKE